MKGIDVPIEAQRAVFEDKLFTGSSSYVAYHRAFVNEKDGLVIPELQTEDSTEYQEVLLNDKIDGHSFFVVRPNIVVADGLLSAKVDIYFALNLDKLYSSVSERAVEYAHRDILNLLKRSRFEVFEIVTGLDAFAGFGNVDLKDNMEPFYLVKFGADIVYQTSEC